MSLVKSFTHLKGRPKEEKALPMLQRVASLVKPIMRQHGWSLPILAEFFPENDSLVDVNGGEKIFLRLRPPWAPDTFYDEEQLVLVMLHELTHNVHGPHDSQFYALLSKLEQEYEDLKRSGYAGEGFHSVGARLGVGVSHNISPRLAKIKALEAAEKRRKAAGVMGGGGRLGGRSVERKRTPRELAAEGYASQAAERRARDEKSCGAGHGINTEIEAQRAARDSTIDVIDVDALPEASASTRSASPEIIILDGPSSPPRKKRILATAPRTSSTAQPPKSKLALAPPSNDEWACAACTLVNPLLALQCAACYASRPRDPTADWTCLACGEQGMPHDFWTCRFCGRLKSES
ncbi:WLM-domain-containing protein [Ramaria rubella]|nr:WLM-domain-containing protein [Ramaria rubella]